MERALHQRHLEGAGDGPRLGRCLGLQGDAVADTRSHGGPDQALLMYADSHYPLWRAEWGREDVGPGAFGENLTVEGMTEDDACIGDVLEIGDGSVPGLPSAPALRDARAAASGPQHDRAGARERAQRMVSAGARRRATSRPGQPVRRTERPHPGLVGAPRGAGHAASPQAARTRPGRWPHARRCRKEWRDRLAKS